jgi:hypothetical protein
MRFMTKEIRTGLAAFALLVLLGAGCGTATTQSTTVTPTASDFSLADIAPTTTPDTNCVLPPVWGEVSNIFKVCQLKEVEKGSGYSQDFNPEGANGIFDYCNTLVFRHYSTVQGNLYTYEKVRYIHYPNSEVGEYRISKALYDSITNSRPCTATAGRYGDLDDDTLSADLFPSRNYHIGEGLPGVDVLSQKDSDAAFANQIPAQQPNPPPTAPNVTYQHYCCKTCSTGKACGDSCISRSYTCHKAPGCACDAY